MATAVKSAETALPNATKRVTHVTGNAAAHASGVPENVTLDGNATVSAPYVLMVRTCDSQ